MSRTRGTDVVVIGGGIVGCATAWELARRGVEVSVLERGTPGREATWAAGGMLSPFTEAGTSGPFLELGLAALDMYRPWLEELCEASGMAVDYRECGQIELAFDREERERLSTLWAWQHDIDPAIEWLEPDELRRLEPALSGSVVGGVFVAREHVVDNRRLGRALWHAAAREGVHFRLGETARALRSSGGRVREVELASGEGVPCGAVVVAAGCWSGDLEGLPAPLPITPVRGQMAAVLPAETLLERILFTPRCYLIPRAEQVIIGSTMERAGYRKETTVGGLAGLLSGAVEAVPELAGATVAETWAGLRPATPDGMPVLGPDPDLAGLWYATGHFRNGILLGPISGVLTAAWIAGESPSLDVGPYRVERFREGTVAG